MLKLPFVSRRRFEAERDERLDAERRANQIEYTTRARQPKPAEETDPWGFPESLAPAKQRMKLSPEQTEQIYSVTGRIVREVRLPANRYVAASKLGMFAYSSGPIKRSNVEKAEGYIAHRMGMSDQLPRSHPFRQTWLDRLFARIRQFWTGVTPPRDEGITTYWTPPRGSVPERVAAWFRFRWIKITRKWLKPKPMAGNVELQSDNYTPFGKTHLPETWVREFKNGVEREPRF